MVLTNMVSHADRASYKDAESYSYEMTDATHRDWKQHVANTTSKALPDNKSFAFCCLAGSNPTPVAVMAAVADQNCAFWHEVMWAAVLAEEFQAGCGDDEFEHAARPFYANVNPQTALAASIDHSRLPHLSKLSGILNTGLGEIQPDASPGRARYVVLVSDSYTVFLAGKDASDPSGPGCKGCCRRLGRIASGALGQRGGHRRGWGPNSLAKEGCFYPAYEAWREKHWPTCRRRGLERGS